MDFECTKKRLKEGLDNLETFKYSEDTPFSALQLACCIEFKIA